jgi:membrane carboxypeptidase/penicillin-binding protein
LWFIGYTPDLTCGAWMGYDDYSPLGRKLGAGGALVPWWAAFMKEAHAKIPVKNFSVPSGIRFVKIDKDTGMLALPTCPNVILEAFLEGNSPGEFCSADHSLLEKPEVEITE